MADKNIDPQVLMTTMMGVIESNLSKMSGIAATDKPQVKETDINEFQGRLFVRGFDKFNAASYISVVNYYVSPADQEKHRAKGALVLYVDLENAAKLFKGLGLSVPEDEDDASMMNCCGEFCNALGNGLKKELAGLGYADLVMSGPRNYRSSIMEGVEFSPDQKKLHEFSFFYWKRKAVVVELTLANVPLRT